jgi:hypothetical protein
MGLLSIDITKKKRLSLGSIKLPEREVKLEPTYPKKVRRPEEEVYSKFIAINPLLGVLVREFDLASRSTGEQIIEKERAYSKEELIDAIGEPELHNRLKNGGIEQALNPEIFFLGQSTPF